MKKLLLAIILVSATISGSNPAKADHTPGTLAKGGVNSHITYGSNTAYHDTTRLGNALATLEAKWIRDAIAPGQPQGYYDKFYPKFEEIARRTGGKFVLIAVRADQSVTAQLDAMAPLVNKGIVGAIEGANEWDNVYGANANWKDMLRAHQEELYRQVKARWPGMPVIAPSLSYKTYDYVGSLAHAVDKANIHYYTSTFTGFNSNDFLERLNGAKRLAGGKELWVTEMNGTLGDGYPSDNETTQADGYRLLMDWMTYYGAHRIFLYEAINQGKTSLTPTHRENNFGAFGIRSDGLLRVKPVFHPALAANRRG